MLLLAIRMVPISATLAAAGSWQRSFPAAVSAIGVSRRRCVNGRERRSRDARFEKTLRRAKERVRERGADGATARILELLDERQRAQRYARRFLVRIREKVIVVNADEIDWIEGAGYYVSLHAGPKAHLLRETMAELETRLDPERFFRVHRSAIVNIERVREVHPLFRGDCQLVLSDGTELRLSRTRRAEFDRLFRR